MRSDLSEKPILKADQDELQIELRIVAKIVNLLSDFLKYLLKVLR